jgi:hypothetical protein
MEKPPVAQLLKNFPTFYGTRRFITVFTTAHFTIIIISLWPITVSKNTNNSNKTTQDKT